MLSRQWTSTKMHFNEYVSNKNNNAIPRKINPINTSWKADLHNKMSTQNQNALLFADVPYAY